MVGSMMTLQWLTFVSATLAAGFQGRRAVRGWLYDRRDRLEARRVRMAGWSQTGVNTWFVQLDESAANPDPSLRTATVTVSVRGKDGQPSPDQADRLRRYLEDNDCLSRSRQRGILGSLRRGSRRLWTGERTGSSGSAPRRQPYLPGQATNEISL